MVLVRLHPPFLFSLRALDHPGCSIIAASNVCEQCRALFWSTAPRVPREPSIIRRARVVGAGYDTSQDTRAPAYTSKQAHALHPPLGLHPSDHRTGGERQVSLRDPVRQGRGRRLFLQLSAVRMMKKCYCCLHITAEGKQWKTFEFPPTVSQKSCHLL